MPRTDEEGYLVDPANWDESVAGAFARAEGIALTPLHWDVRRLMRRLYEARQVAPDARFVVKYLAEERGRGAAASRRLLELFPYGYVKPACRIAGMKRPRAWSTG